MHSDEWFPKNRSTEEFRYLMLGTLISFREESAEFHTLFCRRMLARLPSAAAIQETCTCKCCSNIFQEEIIRGLGKLSVFLFLTRELLWSMFKRINSPSRTRQPTRPRNLVLWPWFRHSTLPNILNLNLIFPYPHKPFSQMQDPYEPPLSRCSVQRSHNTACTEVVSNLYFSFRPQTAGNQTCLKPSRVISLALTLLAEIFERCERPPIYFTLWQCKDHDNAFLAPYLHFLPIVSCGEGDEHDRLGCFGDLLLPVIPTMLLRSSLVAVDVQACTSGRSDVQKEVYRMF